jgi:peptide deformylase
LFKYSRCSEDVYRKETITIEYFDENFQKKTEVYHGLIARVIQHEYDHIEGILFTLIKSYTAQNVLIKKKLQNIMDGKARPDYRMKFCKQKRKIIFFDNRFRVISEKKIY